MLLLGAKSNWTYNQCMTTNEVTELGLFSPPTRSPELLASAAHFVLAHEGIHSGTTGKALALRDTVTARYPHNQNRTLTSDIRHQLQIAVGFAAGVSASIKTWHAKNLFIERIDDELPGEPFRTTEEVYLAAKGLVKAHPI